MAIRAMVYYTPAQPEVARRALYILQVTRPREVTRVPDVNPITVDTGLRAGVKINYRSDSRANFPTALSELIETIKDFEKLDQGWDSYNGFPMNDSAVNPRARSGYSDSEVSRLSKCRSPSDWRHWSTVGNK